jgi:hypothetical protein
MGPFSYWSNTVGPPIDQAYYLNMGNGAFGFASTSNIYGGWAVHDGDVIPDAIVDVTYDTPAIDFGPLSFGLSELPAAPNVTFSLMDGTPAGGGGTSYGLPDVLSATLIFGDFIGPDNVIWPNNFTAFAMEVDASGVATALSYEFAILDTPTAAGIIILNFPFTVTGTDIASDSAFSYTYANSEVTIDSTLATGVGRQPSLATDHLEQNYPNPFNPITMIRFELSTPANVTLRIYDVTGRLIRTLVEGNVPVGPYAVEWDGKNVAGVPASSGVYFYRLTTSRFQETRKMVLLK